MQIGINDLSHRATVIRAFVVAGALALACSSDSGPTGPDTTAGLVAVRDLRPARRPASAAAAHILLGPPSGATVTYVSLPPGSIPNGSTATITVVRTGYTVVVNLVAGGFDPVAVPAEVGDSIAIKVQSTGAGPMSYTRIVPASADPIVVRTDPPPHKRDVPLNVRMMVVFSEPMDSATLHAGSLQLWHQSTQVLGLITVGDPAHLTATFTPDAPLAALTDYELRVTQEVRGFDGAPLKVPVAVPFNTVAVGTAPLFTVGVWVYGLAGSGLELLNNGGDPLGVDADRSTTFFTPLPSGAAYSVTVFSQPTNPAQNCVVTNGSGTVVAANVTNVDVFCTTLITGNLVFASVSVGLWHNCGVTTTGAAYCWGENWSGALGDGTTTNSSTPVAVAGGLTLASVSAGRRYTCGVTTSGALYCWGGNELFPFSTGGAPSPTRPVPVATGLTFASVSAGKLARLRCHNQAGAAYCWGDGILAAGGLRDTMGFLAVQVGSRLPR